MHRFSLKKIFIKKYQKRNIFLNYRDAKKKKQKKTRNKPV